ncbi:MAG: TIGR03557 family F420-dependent LLM class oxidoreductase [Acidimicrobiia bacterium]|nr:TIGR03557 family F420-dependent LLM class oxidoreductase [Acidimicrobiia bacterium]
MPAERQPPRVGYWLSSEEHPAPTLVANAAAAEAAGFRTAMLSDHFHPWTPTQGQSPFAWAVLGAIAGATTELEVGTGVSAAVHRLHPAILAQAAATVATLMPGRFFLGLGSGERLNEHITGERWPGAGERRDMLAEVVEILRALWAGKNVNHRGEHFTVENARLFSLPVELPKLFVASSGSRSAALAGEIADGMISVAPDAKLVETFEGAGGAGKPRLGQLHVCVAPDEDEARRTALRWWPNGGIGGAALTDLARPEDFAALAGPLDADDLEGVLFGNDPDRHLDAIRRYVGAGFDSVYVHQIGPDQRGFLDLYRDHVLPRL